MVLSKSPSSALRPWTKSKKYSEQYNKRKHTENCYNFKYPFMFLNNLLNIQSNINNNTITLYIRNISKMENKYQSRGHEMQ